jgi:hypothetical protein
MAFLHLINCLILTYAPIIIVYKSTALADYGWKVCLFSGLGYLATSLVKMLAYASFVPLYETGFQLHVELIKAAISLIDIYGIKFLHTWDYTRVGDK